MATNVPDPLQQIMELMTGLMSADQNSAEVRRETIERARQGFTVVRTPIMMHQQQIMNMIPFEGKMKETGKQVEII